MPGILMSVMTTSNASLRTLLEGVAAAVDGRDLVALLAQHDPQELGHALFVVDDENLFRRHRLHLVEVVRGSGQAASASAVTDPGS